MKLLVLISIALSFFSYSQNEGRYELFREKEKSNYWSFPQRELYNKHFIKENGIKKYLRQVKTSKGEYISHQVFFDENGQKEKTISYGDTTLYIYQNDSILKKEITIGKRNKEVFYSYQNGQVTSIQTYSKGKLTSLSMREYNDDNKLTSELFQNGKNLRNSHLLNYFYEEGRLKQQKFYTNGELTNSWDYSCGAEGKEEKKMRSTAICEYIEESNDGSYIKYKRRLNGKFVNLSKQYFTKDSTLCKLEVLGSDNTIYRTVLYTKSSTISTRFDAKGRIIEKKIYSFDDLRKNITIRGKKQNKSHTYLTYYNNLGLVSKNENIYKGKPTMLLTYDYEFY